MFFALDGCGGCGEAFEVDEFVDVVFCGVAEWALLAFVLSDTDFDVGGDADVELLEAVGEYVNVGVFVHDPPFF